jgi:hypothetical protein
MPDARVGAIGDKGISVSNGQDRAVDDPAIVQALSKLYEVISFEEGAEPNWSGLQAVFHERARITRITPEGSDYLEPASFLAMTRNMVELGAYTSFYEFELEREVRKFGNMAQVWSLYETRRNRSAEKPLGRGINSIQLIYEGDRWRVLGLLWDEQQAERQQPEGL